MDYNILMDEIFLFFIETTRALYSVIVSNLSLSNSFRSVGTLTLIDSVFCDKSYYYWSVDFVAFFSTTIFTLDIA